MSFSRHAASGLLAAVALGLTLAAIMFVGHRVTEVDAAVPPRLLSNQALEGSLAGIIRTNGHRLERDGEPFEARGMNYYPKDHAWDRFWADYAEATSQIDTELDLARALGVNTVRIFVSYDLFDGSDQTHLDHLKDLLERLQARDMVAIVTLFDLYSSPPYTDYLASKRHIDAVISALEPTNDAIMAWDIKNEPDRDYAEYGEDTVKDWLGEMISYTRSLDPNHLVTIGFYGAVTGTLCYDPTITDELVYSPTIAAEFASSVDFVSMHYFLPERCFESDLQTLQALSGDKPVVLEEFGLHTLNTGADRHTEIEQAAYYNALLSLSEANGAAGYLFWTLSDFSYILSNSQESHHCQGILRNSLADVCEVTTTLDYTEKPAAGTVRHHYQDGVAYLDLFDGWVVQDTDEAPPGWSDNWSEGGALLRGYNPSQLLWSHDLGRIAFSKFVTNGTSITGLAVSPVLTDVNVDQYPLLAGQVFSYQVRSELHGSDCTLHVGVKDGWQVTRLLTVTPSASLPLTFSLDLRLPPLNWSGTRSFQIALELVPEGTSDGYSAAYELDWIAQMQMLRVAKQASPSPVQPGSQLTYTIRLTNIGNVDLHANITDTLPHHITPSGVLIWTPTITALGTVWTKQVVVTVDADYEGPLTNMVLVTTDEGANGTASATVCANVCRCYLPVVLKDY